MGQGCANSNTFFASRQRFQGQRPRMAAAKRSPVWAVKAVRTGLRIIGASVIRTVSPLCGGSFIQFAGLLPHRAGELFSFSAPASLLTRRGGLAGVAVLLALAGCQPTPVSTANDIDKAAGTGLQISDHADAIIRDAGLLK